jgi:hypothetical protein
MTLDPEDKEKLARIAQSLEGIEMLLAMWLEKSMPAAELWVREGPDTTLIRRPWRPESA